MKKELKKCRTITITVTVPSLGKITETFRYRKNEKNLKEKFLDFITQWCTELITITEIETSHGKPPEIIIEPQTWFTKFTVEKLHELMMEYYKKEMNS